MIRPLIHMMANEPELLTDHLQCYAELLGEEVGSYQSQFKRQGILFGALALLVVVTLILAGVALMLWLITPTAQLQQLQLPWAVWLVPGGLAILCVIITLLINRKKRPPGFLALRQQFAADVAMLKEATAS